MHPSKFGHQFIAQQFAVLLRERGYFIGEVQIDPINNRSRKDSILWMLRNGTPWFLKRSVDLFPGLIWLSGAELIYILRQKYSQFKFGVENLQKHPTRISLAEERQNHHNNAYTRQLARNFR
jgi:hypothetical protein